MIVNMSNKWKKGERPATPHLDAGLSVKDIAILRRKFNQILISSPHDTAGEMSVKMNHFYVTEDKAAIWMRDSRLSSKRVELEKEVVIREDFKNVPTSLGHIISLFSREIVGRLADGKHKDMTLTALLSEQRRCLEMAEKYARLMRDFNPTKDEDKKIDVIEARVKAEDTESS